MSDDEREEQLAAASRAIDEWNQANDGHPAPLLPADVIPAAREAGFELGQGQRIQVSWWRAEAPPCVCGRPKNPYHTDQPTAPGAPWHPYTAPTGRHEHGCLAVSGPHDTALCERLWEKSDRNGTEETP